MDLKERLVPKIILKLHAILERPPGKHEKVIIMSNDLSKYHAGYNGEQSIDFYLQYKSKN
jgi:hypothetical protein